jgi:hypothetical protein
MMFILNYPEGIRIQLELMTSTMMDDQFIVHILNNLTREYRDEVETWRR